MSLNKLVGGECGGGNSLVRLSAQVGRDASARGGGAEADALVTQFLSFPSPTTFNMSALLGSVPVPDVQAEPVARTSHTPHTLTPALIRFQPPIAASVYPPWHQPQTMRHTSHRPPFNVQIQYMSDADLKTDDGERLRATARRVAETANEQEQGQFITFMKNISAGGLDFSQPQQDRTSKLSQEEILNRMEEKYKEEWARLSDVSANWRESFGRGIPAEYTFANKNVMLENKNALEIGKEKLSMGDVPGAVLCFEAAVRREPELAEAWLLLGTTQAENEQDPAAIAALRRALQLQPDAPAAHATLAAAYANENLAELAFLALLDYLKATPRYAHLVPADVDPGEMNVKQLEAHVKGLLIAAAQTNREVDPDVQNALGVLFNITLEHDKAVDCFRTALAVTPDDSKLWNRLGATLANSERSEEAVGAYRQALDLEPGFVRARYNVGITCMNLGAYRQAAEHFLVALNQQNKAKPVQPDADSADNSSSTIWSTLRMVCAFMGEQAIVNFVDERNLTELNRHFELQ